ncbi:branched-chain amino acid ABC transporter permease [bacterium]|nr:branched-chain amino acid ABC transporter permease [bacterium]
MSLFFQQLINGLAWGGIYALIAIGYTMVYGIMQLINFAHGDVFMAGAFAGYVIAQLLPDKSSLPSVILVFLSAMLFSTFLGILIERLGYRSLWKKNAPRLSLLIVAVAISLLLENVGLMIFGAAPRSFPSIIPSRSFSLGSISFTNIQVIVILSSLVLMVALQLIVMRTKMGRAMRAVAEDSEMSALLGIPRERILSFTFALGSALAGVAGVMVAIYTPQINPLMGILPGLKAFVSAVLGGIGSIPGAMLGGFVLGEAETLVSAYISSSYRDLLAFLILIFVLLFLPSGLLGKGVAEKL